MENRQVTIDVLVDEVIGVGKWNGMYIQFAEDGQFIVKDAGAVADAYLAAGAKIPGEFSEVRAIIEGKINSLQAVL